VQSIQATQAGTILALAMPSHLLAWAFAYRRRENGFADTTARLLTWRIWISTAREIDFTPRFG
jgi:hypothetical protein